MATPTQTPPKTAQPMLPPDEEFWEKYSPHYEFPLSSIGSIALHVAGLMIFLGALYMLSKMTLPDTGPVPMREMTIMGDGDSSTGAAGSGGGGPAEDVSPLEKPSDPMREVPEKVLQEVQADVKDFVPTIPQDADAPKIEDLPSLSKFAKLNDDLRKKLLPGKGGNKGAGDEQGKGPTAQEGAGPGGRGDATNSINRAVRWELIFKTENGRDYVNQLGAMKATLVIPQPPDFKKSLAYRNPQEPRPKGEPFDITNIPGLYFIDDSKDSASKVARTLGLDFDPPLFVAFFPKDVEEQLAAEERKFRGRREDQIFSTKFKILIRDGKYSVQVTDQIPVKR